MGRRGKFDLLTPVQQEWLQTALLQPKYFGGPTKRVRIKKVLADFATQFSVPITRNVMRDFITSAKTRNGYHKTRITKRIQPKKVVGLVDRVARLETEIEELRTLIGG